MHFFSNVKKALKQIINLFLAVPVGPYDQAPIYSIGAG